MALWGLRIWSSYGPLLRFQSKTTKGDRQETACLRTKGSRSQLCHFSQVESTHGCESTAKLRNPGVQESIYISTLGMVAKNLVFADPSKNEQNQKTKNEKFRLGLGRALGFGHPFPWARLRLLLGCRAVPDAAAWPHLRWAPVARRFFFGGNPPLVLTKETQKGKQPSSET